MGWNAQGCASYDKYRSLVLMNGLCWLQWEVEEWKTKLSEAQNVMAAVGEERDSLTKDKDDAVKDRDSVTEERDTAVKERDSLIEERDNVIKERDIAVKERDSSVEERGIAVKERDSAVEDKYSAVKERDQLQLTVDQNKGSDNKEIDDLTQEISRLQDETEEVGLDG